MATLNSLLRQLFDLLLSPFAGLPSVVPVTAISVVVGVAMLWVYKKTSNQQKIEDVKQQIFASVFEIRLFNDNLPAIFRAQGDIFRRIPRYLSLSFVPLAWMLLPMVLLIAQLQFHYGYQGLQPGQPVLLKATLKPGASLPQDAAGALDVALSAPEGLKVEAGPVWVPALREVSWRLAAERPGSYQLTLKAGSESLTKTAVSSEKNLRRSPIRVGGAVLDQLLYPAEDPIPATSPFAEVKLDYPEAEVNLLGWHTHWLIAFFVLSLVAAFALKGWMGVEL